MWPCLVKQQMNEPIYFDKLRVMTQGNQDKKIYN